MRTTLFLLACLVVALLVGAGADLLYGAMTPDARPFPRPGFFLGASASFMGAACLVFGRRR